ncbi:OmpA family protein [Spirosoma sp. BT702]|uniref:OmpA family protein n=1 Tax=Spirosoma profusum TaxID=2771354 RepID=A0A926XYS8_9BACT|nr:OmpA family protein [Spirosoma profusum]MBD2703267.1 OmpA family protein [Spirosoma profusum]
MKNFLAGIFLLPLPCLAQDIKAYQNYDFVAGDKIIFADDLADSPPGEFDPHWKLIEGQAVVNKVSDEKAFFITKYYTKLAPRVKTPAYLPKNFTLEFDSYLDAAYDSNEGIYIQFLNDTEPVVNIRSNRDYSVFDGPDTKLNGEYPKAIAAENYFNKWHHYAIAVKDNQVKIYCDQYRVLVVPEVIFKATSLLVGGDASDGKNMMFRNFKLAAGGDMNLIGKAFTDGKYISHGILFDVNKATLKPESMGEINAIVNVLTANPNLKVDVSGHTDADGDDASNLKLSEARANTVKSQLVSMGIEATRLTAKGYGETKPIADNATFEGKAQNRRVEFVKQ